jgi:hypothetical protein
MILEMPPINTATPTKVPIAQTELDGYLMMMRSPIWSSRKSDALAIAGSRTRLWLALARGYRDQRLSRA